MNARKERHALKEQIKQQQKLLREEKKKFKYLQKEVDKMAKLIAETDEEEEEEEDEEEEEEEETESEEESESEESEEEESESDDEKAPLEQRKDIFQVSLSSTYKTKTKGAFLAIHFLFSRSALRSMRDDWRL